MLIAKSVCSVYPLFRSLARLNSRKMVGDHIANGTVDLSQLKPPTYVAPRLLFWEQLKLQYKVWLEKQINSHSNDKISVHVKLSDGKQVTVDCAPFEKSALDIIKTVDSKLAGKTVAIRVDDTVRDAFVPMENSCVLEPLTYDDPAGKEVFWHSSAHVLGEAMEWFYGGDLCYGPTVETGFYYDMYMPEKTIAGADLPLVEQLTKKFIKEKQPFERLIVSKDDLLKLFSGNPFKQRIIREKIHTETASVYRCGSLVDLCRGPHVPNTSLITCLKVVKNSSSYWEGDASKEHLQRMYGISFPDKKQMAEWVKFQKQAAERNHRKIGIDQELFFFNEMSPGSCFFYPKGAHIYKKLEDLMRNEYRNRGFDEVITPNVFNYKLWKTSGHWDHYAENMFSFEAENIKFALKPMNCPGHCIMYSNRQRSWRELPIRYADFGVLHRNELSGTLSGLTRVRRFQQDDAHIFCMNDQLKDEIMNCLNFMRWTYGIFGFKFRLQLSTRPEKHMGDIDTWNKAEKQLENALIESGEEWSLNPGDGAFYGPKIDVTISDAMNRQHQCATIQLDFQLPARFNLTYVSGEDNQLDRPVMIHRAILGSIERMMGIVTEHFGGKWPFWLSPRQACVVPVASTFDNYAISIKKRLYKSGFEAECKLDPSMSLNKKIRTAQVEQFNFILVVGETELNNQSVNVRQRDGKAIGEMNLEELLTRFDLLNKSRSLDESVDFEKPDDLIARLKEL